MRARTLVPFLVLTNAGVIGTLLLSGRAERPPGFELEKARLPEAEAAGEPGGPSATVRLESLIVRVRSEDGERFMRAGFDVEMERAQDKDVVMQRMSQIRDALIRYFMDRTKEELLGSEELAASKEAVKKRVQQICAGHRVHAVYIYELVIH